MLEITIENEYGERLDLHNNISYILGGVTGVTPPAANINTTSIATKDGSVFNSSFLGNRNIVLTIYPQLSIERSRINIYKYIKAKHYIKLYIKNASREVWTDGYVDSLEIDINENPQKIQASIICPDPYLKAIDTIEVAFENQEATVINNSDEAIGFIAEFNFTGDVENLHIENETTGEEFTVIHDFFAAEKLTLNTRRGEKSVILASEGFENIDLISDIDMRSTWIQLANGENVLTYSATTGEGYIAAKVTIQPIFEGV